MAAEDPLRRKLSERFADFEVDPRPDLRAAILASVAPPSASRSRIRWQTVLSLVGLLGLLLTSGRLGDTLPSAHHKPVPVKGTRLGGATRTPNKNNTVDRLSPESATGPVDASGNVTGSVGSQVRQAQPKKYGRRYVTAPKGSADWPQEQAPVRKQSHPVARQLSLPRLPALSTTRLQSAANWNIRNSAFNNSSSTSPVFPPEEMAQTSETSTEASSSMAAVNRLAIRPFTQPRRYRLPAVIESLAPVASERVKAKRTTQWRLSVGIAPLLSYQEVIIPGTTGPSLLIQDRAGTFSRERAGYQTFMEVEKTLWPQLSIAGSLRYSHLRMAGTYAHWTGRYKADFSSTDTPGMTPELAPVRSHTRIQTVSLRADLVYKLQTSIPLSLRFGTEYERGLSQPLTNTYIVLGAGFWHRISGHRLAIEPAFRYALSPQFGLMNALVQTRPYSVSLAIRVPLN